MSMYEAAKRRPANYDRLGPGEQWEIDGRLGILDWDGTDDRPVKPTRIARTVTRIREIKPRPSRP